MRPLTRTALFATSLLVLAILLSVAACGLLPVTPEQQIRDGANSITVGATLAGSALSTDRITKAQAVSYREILNTASKHLDVAFKDLEACRQKTASTPKSNPDPCRPVVQSDINLGVAIATELRRTLDAKQAR